MYAIVKTGGKQYRVERGQTLLVERLAVEEGANVALQPLFYRSDEPVLDKAALEQVNVTAKVLEHVRGEKLRVFKFKPKRGYKRRNGHRQELTRIEVTEISAGKAKAQAAKAKAPAKASGEAPAKAKAAGEAPAKAKAAGEAPAKAKASTKDSGEAPVKAPKAKKEAAADGA
jgi:large subunit ribosomal protein L21